MRTSHWILSRAVERIVLTLTLIAAAILLTPIVLLAALPFIG